MHLLQEEDNWYYGYMVYNRAIKGIFPKNFVYVIECSVDNSGLTPVFILKQPPIAQEITTVLREWSVHWKKLYVVSWTVGRV